MFHHELGGVLYSALHNLGGVLHAISHWLHMMGGGGDTWIA